MTKKKFALAANQIKPLATGRGACIATDMIVVDGRKVGYMFRGEPSNEQESGWVFTSGLETQEYMDDAGNHGVYDVNTIANYDSEIIPFLNAPIGTSFERAGRKREFVQVDGDPWTPGSSARTSDQRWPPPGFPLVTGQQRLTETWAVHLPEQFARRMEDGSLVFWRPGLTIWLTAWNNDQQETQAQRLTGLKKHASQKCWDDRESRSGGVTRFSYRLLDENENGSVDSLIAVVFADSGHLQLSIYFDDAKDEPIARQIADSVSAQGQ